jgi:hypothetical protein
LRKKRKKRYVCLDGVHLPLNFSLRFVIN